MQYLQRMCDIVVIIIRASYVVFLLCSLHALELSVITQLCCWVIRVGNDILSFLFLSQEQWEKCNNTVLQTSFTGCVSLTVSSSFWTNPETVRPLTAQGWHLATTWNVHKDSSQAALFRGWICQGHTSEKAGTASCRGEKWKAWYSQERNYCKAFGRAGDGVWRF